MESLRAPLPSLKSPLTSIVILLSGSVSDNGSCNLGFCINAGSTAKKKYMKKTPSDAKPMISQVYLNPRNWVRAAPTRGARQLPIPYALLKIPEALSHKNGVCSRPSFSATADTISGSKGTNTKDTENPRNPIPDRVRPNLLIMLKYWKLLREVQH